MIKNKMRLFTLTVLIAVFGINAFFGYPRLSNFSAVDEPYWTYERIPDFWRAVKEKRWKRTKINDKPGITVALVTGPGLFWINPLDYETYRQKPKTEEILTAINKISFIFRLPLYLFILSTIPLFYFFIKKLFNRQIALLSTIFIFLSPIILGISLIINPDSLLWIFLPLSMITHLIFLKNKEKKYLIGSGIFLGLSLLTKYVANILFIYFFAIIFLEYIFNDKQVGTKITKYIKQEFLNYLLLSLTAIATFFILFPATWESPELILKSTFLSDAFKSTWPLFLGIIAIIAVESILLKGKVLQPIINFIRKKKSWIITLFTGIFLTFSLFALINPFLGMKNYNFEEILASPKSGRDFSASGEFLLSNISSDFWALLYGISPLALLLFLFSIIKILKQEEKYRDENRVIFYFIFFTLLYYFGSSFNGIGATVRYQIVIYPLAFIVSAIGIYRFIEIEKIKQIKKIPIFETIIILMLLASLWSLLSIKPFYFSYASSLLPKDYVLNVREMGDGSFEMAKYLNSLPGAKEMIIWSDKGAVCERFIGKCVTDLDKKDFILNNYDYFTLSSGRASKTIDRLSDEVYDFRKLYYQDKTSFEIFFDNRPGSFVKVIKNENASRPKK